MAWSWKNTGAVTGQVATLAEIKKQLEIATSDTSHDGQLTALLEAAKRQFETQTRYLIGTRDVSLTIDHFASEPLYLPIRPFNSLAGITVNGTSILADVTTDLDHQPPRIYPTDYSWPSTTEPIANVVITGNAGQDVTTLPQDIKHSILLLAASWFEYREDTLTGTIVTSLPIGVRAIWDSYKIGDGYLTSFSDGGGTNA